MFTDVYIRRPILAVVVSLIILLLGLVSLDNLPVRQYPKIENSVIQVRVTYPGATAQLMEGFVTTPVENAISGIEGMDYMTSSSTQSSSVITVNLKVGYDINKGMTDIQSKVSSVRWKLPKNIQDPVIAKNDENAYPIVFIAFTSETMSPEAVTDFLLRVVQPQFETIPGISQASILGERQYAMRINLNPNLMTSYGVTAADVYDALFNNNLQAPAGTINGRMQGYNIYADTDLNDVRQFNNLVVKHNGSHLVRIRDVGKTTLGASNYTTSAFSEGKQTTVIGIIPLSTANPLAVASGAIKMLPQIERELPEGVKTKVIYNSAEFIQESIDEVYRTIVEAVVFVIFVVFLFLGSFRSVIIPIVTIPLSIIGVCAIMLTFNYTINTLTLLAWVLAIGLVVDDAIIVVENIHRHMAEGLNAFYASVKGTREITFAIIVMTFTLVAVFAPIGFTPGMTGILFREFAFTLAFAVVISGIIALTLSPMMCSKLFNNYTPGKMTLFIDEQFEKFQSYYKKILRFVVSHTSWVIVTVIVLYAICFYAFTHTKQQLAPIEDQGVIFSYGTAPSAANIKYIEKYTKELSPIYASIPEVKKYLNINGFPGKNNSLSVIALKPWSERKLTSMQITQELFPKLMQNTGMQLITFAPPPLPGSGITPIQIDIKSTGSYEELNILMQKLLAEARKYPGFQSPITNLKLDKPQITAEINRDKAGVLGIDMRRISNNLNYMFASPTNIQFNMNGRGYYVIPEYTNNFAYKNNPHSLNDLYLRTNNDKLVPMSSIVKIKTTVVPQSLNHFQQLRSAEIESTVTPGYTISQDIDYLKKVAAKILPNNVALDYAGQSRQFMQAGTAMEQAMLFAVIFIFLVLAAQFESFRDPLTVMTVVPLAMSGALLGLNFLQASSVSLSIYSKIGLLTLVGLIAKHGILIVEFANQLQEENKLSVFDAIVESAAIRLRPILMTTMAMVLGVIPLAVASGAGSVSRNQIGSILVGGLLIGTLFSLFVVPAFYLVISKLRGKIIYGGAIVVFIIQFFNDLFVHGALNAMSIAAMVMTSALAGIAIAIVYAAFDNKTAHTPRAEPILIDETQLNIENENKQGH